MKIIAILFSMFGLALLFGCTNQPGEITAILGQEVELKIGQTISIEEEQIKVKFTEVVSDSRCPSGATCIWQGEVTCVLDITYLNSTYQKTIIQPGLTQEPSRDVFKEYSMTFNVLPYPELGKDIEKNEYYLQLRIEKNGLIENINWFLRSYGELNNLQEIIEGSEITAMFDSIESQVSGSAGCNIYGASYQIVGNLLSFSGIYYTEMACISPEGIMQQEQEFLLLLSKAQSYQADNTTLTIFCSGNQELYFTTATR